MSCYKELSEKVREKCGEDALNDLCEWAFAMLETSDPRSYQQIMDKMEHKAYEIKQEEAEQIVKAMRPRGEMWTYNQIKDYIATHGITDNIVSWYLAMNMCYNDYLDTARAFGHQDDAEYFFSLAKDFITDEDAKKYKLEKYFTM